MLFAIASGKSEARAEAASSVSDGPTAWVANDSAAGRRTRQSALATTHHTALSVRLAICFATRRG